ncbi:hypothetical protein EVAR_51819_1 [Eumeta japonica]|uniref:Uncharacterized protein n=1 Tax=Eumeta variegata TaxID=151549 RepID=A0A4C1XYX9_EUMVA|nr:hypothetical protein EVAR_51819_1 [Eumeta japonica]
MYEAIFQRTHFLKHTPCYKGIPLLDLKLSPRARYQSGAVGDFRQQCDGIVPNRWLSVPPEAQNDRLGFLFVSVWLVPAFRRAVLISGFITGGQHRTFLTRIITFYSAVNKLAVRVAYGVTLAISSYFMRTHFHVRYDATGPVRRKNEASASVDGRAKIGVVCGFDTAADVERDDIYSTGKKTIVFIYLSGFNFVKCGFSYDPRPARGESDRQQHSNLSPVTASLREIYSDAPRPTAVTRVRVLNTDTYNIIKCLRCRPFAVFDFSTAKPDPCIVNGHLYRRNERPLVQISERRPTRSPSFHMFTDRENETAVRADVVNRLLTSSYVYTFHNQLAVNYFIRQYEAHRCKCTISSGSILGIKT